MVSVWPSQSARDADADAWSRWPDAGVVESSVALVPTGLSAEMRPGRLVFLAASILAASAITLADAALAAGADAAPGSPSTPQISPNIAVSPATLPYVGVQVVGKPRFDTKHPNVFWDQEDIDHYKDMLRSSRELQVQFEDLKRRMDRVVGQPVSIPQPQKGPDGNWLFPGAYFPPFPGRADVTDPRSIFSLYFKTAAYEVSDLGTVYALTGDEKYAKHARDILIGYSNCSRYGAPEGLDKRSINGLVGPLFGEALLLQFMTRGYDLISSSQSVSAEDRTRIHDELLRPLAAEMLYPGARKGN